MEASELSCSYAIIHGDSATHYANGRHSRSGHLLDEYLTQVNSNGE